MSGATEIATGECIFCSECEAGTSSLLVVHRGEHCFVILNKFPYNNGHLMVVPNRHVGRLADLHEPELNELASLTKIAEMVLTEAYSPNGLNVGINLGRAAGAGAPDHLHVHLVPRWDGDTNFMTVVSETRVVPEEPGETARRLTPLFKKVLG